jgi:hypothetical protein
MPRERQKIRSLPFQPAKIRLSIPLPLFLCLHSAALRVWVFALIPLAFLLPDSKRVGIRILRLENRTSNFYCVALELKMLFRGFVLKSAAGALSGDAEGVEEISPGLPDSERATPGLRPLNRIHFARSGASQASIFPSQEPSQISLIPHLPKIPNAISALESEEFC